MLASEVLKVVESGVVEGPVAPFRRGRLALPETHSRPEHVVEGEEEGVSELAASTEVLDVMKDDVVVEGPGDPFSRGRLALTETHSRPEQVVEGEEVGVPRLVVSGEVLNVAEDNVVEGLEGPFNRGRLALTETHSRPEQVVEGEGADVT